jgi:hypothetical protein
MYVLQIIVFSLFYTIKSLSVYINNVWKVNISKNRVELVQQKMSRES